MYNEHRRLVAKLHYHDNMLEGVSRFYNNGVLTELRKYKHNVAEGWGCLIEKGRESLWLRYKNGRRVSVFVHVGDSSFRREIDISSGYTVSIAQYNKEHRVHGICYKFNDSMIKKITKYDNGEELFVMKSFENGDMLEYRNGYQVCLLIID